jgi:hypothetical protein
MRIGSITRKVLMNWYALSFTAIFTLGLTGAVGLASWSKDFNTTVDGCTPAN